MSSLLKNVVRFANRWVNVVYFRCLVRGLSNVSFDIDVNWFGVVGVRMNIVMSVLLVLVVNWLLLTWVLFRVRGAV